MFKFVVILASLVSATAFTMAPRTVRSSSLKMSFEDELGVLPPVGFWDPLGLSSDGDEVVFKRRREVELKHGRVSMLAVLGYLVAEIARFPGSIDLDGTSFQSIPNGVGAITVIPAFGWFQIAASVGYWEIFGWQKASDTAGDFGTGYFGKSLEGEEKAEKLTKEIQNGRLAMLGIMELLTHDVARPAGESLFMFHHF
ncbi:chlorophyll a/b-binding protein domain-containing protein [Ochromonadaceae sp. CCMP2298]|nr:chlorophyll a/b-binding protein domain-containing protein [Ochromonadaceae sp. CCMP2298]